MPQAVSASCSAILETDYLIIGAGTSGCVLADRLSEDGKYQVDVVEAGGSDSYPWLYIPIGYAKTILNPKYNWKYETEPEPELKNRKIYWPRGKVVGGSGAINGLVHIRGQREDYDGWRNEGCPGWGYEDLLPYFKKSEDYFGGASELHGSGGPIAVSAPRDRSILCERVIQSAVAAGLRRNDDFNGEQQEGVGYYDLTTRRGLRSSTGFNMLGRAINRSNVRVHINSPAQRLLIESGRVTGASVLQSGTELKFKARREVLLCLGAVNSPQLLMVSGIGPGEHLRDMGIEVKVDQPDVGQHLQDHLQCRMVLQTKEPITQNDALRNWTGKLGIGLNYIFRRRGLMTFAAGQVGMMFKSKEELDRPDGQVLQFSFSSPKTGEPTHPFSGFTMTVSQMRPESRGWIALKSPEMTSPPAIHANYLSTPLDRQFYLDGIRFMRKVLAHEPLAGSLSAEYWPGAGVVSDEAVMDYVRGMAGSIFHPCGTVRMGNAKSAPVEPSLCFKGLEGLRVVDASIIPSIPSGNINAICIALAEKGADMILKSNR